MKKEETIQSNWRLPKSLVRELDAVVAECDETKTDIVRDAIAQKVARKRRQIERKKAQDLEAVSIV